MPLAWFHFSFYSVPLFRVFRDTRTPNSSGIAPLYMYGGIDGDWNDERAMDPARGFFYLCQIIAIGSSGRKAGKHSRYLQIAMRHARASVFLPSFAPSLDEIHPRPVMAHPLLFVSFTPFREATRTETLQRLPIPVAKHVGRSIYFCFFFFFFPSFLSSILSPRVQIRAQVST